MGQTGVIFAIEGEFWRFVAGFFCLEEFCSCRLGGAGYGVAADSSRLIISVNEAPIKRGGGWST